MTQRCPTCRQPEHDNGAWWALTVIVVVVAFALLVHEKGWPW